MAPIKLEDHIREKLQERELEPSQEGWSKLEERLDQTIPEATGTNRNYMWYAIAASFIGLVVVASFFFNKSAHDANSIVVSEDAVEKTEELEGKIKLEENTPDEIVPIDSQKPLAVENKSISEEQVTEQEVDKAQRKSEQLSEAVATNQNANVNKKALDITDEAPSDNSFEKVKIAEVVTQIESFKNEDKQVNPTEIDELLKNAQRDIQNERTLQKKRVDAVALLDDVEFEMEQTIKEKVFMALGDGFEQIKTAVTERNQ